MKVSTPVAMPYVTATLLAAIGLALGFNLIDRRSTGTVAERRFVPHTVVLRETITSEDGTAKAVALHTYALRSDGATLIQSVDLDEKRPARQRLTQFLTGVKRSFDDVRELVSSTLHDGNRPVHRFAVDKCLLPNEQATIVGTEVVEGHTAVKLLRRGLTTWHALDLGCAPIRQRLGALTRPSNAKDSVAIVAGEPDQNLFDAPPHYREVTPSNLYRMRPDSPAAIQRDKWYSENRWIK